MDRSTSAAFCLPKATRYTRGLPFGVMAKSYPVRTAIPFSKNKKGAVA